jgi:predicted thioredoxin/glutaredoxin
LECCSGRKIVEILKEISSKDAGKYNEDDIAHMCRVVSKGTVRDIWLRRKEKSKQDPNLRGSKSLKNWGHDPAKA